VTRNRGPSRAGGDLAGRRRQPDRNRASSGTGKTHILCAIGHALVEAGHTRLLTPGPAILVQRLQAARRRPRSIERLWPKLDKVRTDHPRRHQLLPQRLGWKPAFLFELIARRFEYRSIAIAAKPTLQRLGIRSSPTSQ